ncbi:griselysin. Metallo peptidase. MEROPS family M04 [Streptomyces pini]|uniref:Neutral metalloproteinase n=1 Tax=Streptomyces pini TaxID=1520580 RepID=A0A1I3V2A1_9ACTN|nr:M4 family metallopeptidase [Streptomyces pini]SFJ89079.1 griselysin. Metallo peptidase. MEROPS family M04 [Streptomyces pini]
MIGRSTPRRRATATGALVAASALLAVGLQSQVSTAAPQAKPDPGALSVELSPSQRAELLRDAEAGSSATARALGLGAKEKLVVRDVVKNADGTVHTRYERTYDGLPVLGGDLVVEESPGGAVAEVAKATAAKIAVPSTAAAASKKPSKAAAEGSTAPRKVVWAAGDKPVLAWERVVGGTQEDGTPSELHIVTDAATGEKLAQWEGVHTGTGESMYSGRVSLGTSGSGGSYTMTDANRGNHRTYDLNGGSSGTGTLFSDADDLWGNGSPSNRQTAGVDAHYGAALTWDYYKNVHGRNGIRGDGKAPYSRVHYGNAYVNAFWSDSCFCMTYGDGANNSKPLTSIDVAAHEMTHGLTSNTAGLRYSGESGGLNEATSDIFAAAVEFRANNSSDVGDYLVGEKIDIRGNGTPLRYMDKPSRDGNSKDYWYSGIGSVDVHYSSGPANHFFYLLSEGSGAKTVNGVSYDSPTSDGKPVTGIGIGAAEKIWFKALTEKMTSTTNYAGARTATLSAAADLFGTDSVQHKAVAHAWAAVNVGSRPDDGGGEEPGDNVFENTGDYQIPDPGTVESPITVNRAGNAPSGLKVDVDIVHTYRGDLVIDLVAPDGSTYRLKNSGWDSGDDVRASYTVNASTEAASGTWKLRVQDVYRTDSGYINSWKLTF